MDKIVKSIFDTRVTAETLSVALAAIATLSQEERRDMTDRAVTIIAALDDAGLLDDQDDLPAAVEFRLRALAKLAKLTEFAAWSIPCDVEGAAHIDPIILAATATEPLIQVDQEPSFNPQSFFQHLLYISDSAGKS